MTNTPNILELWHKEALVVSSSLNIRPLVDKIIVEKIYSTLSKHFPKTFFNKALLRDKSLDQISWIITLLSNPRHLSSIRALHDIAELITYVYELPEDALKEEFKNLIKNPINLRSFFFEILIFSLLDKHNIPNKKRVLSNNQVLEGVLTLHDIEYLFECRKIFYPRLHEFDIARRLMVFLTAKVQSYYYPKGLIVIADFKKPIKGAHFNHYSSKLTKYLQKFSLSYDESIFDEDKFGQIKISTYNQADLLEAKMIKKSALIFAVKPPALQNNNLSARITVHSLAHLTMPTDVLYEKLETVLKEKKRQHKNSSFKNKILFLDSETLPEFQMGLFQQEKMFDVDRIKALYEKVKLDMILCVIRRGYTKKDSKIAAHFIFRQKDKEAITMLQKIFA